ncbi:MAG: transporter, partial [Epsilonproteobacteria bacterium]
STFLYTFVLIFHIKFNRDGYNQDMQEDKQSIDKNISKYTKNVVEILEKDAITKAYSRVFIEDIITNELARSSRYNLDLSVLILKLSKKDVKDKFNTLGLVGEIVREHIRLNDYFGKLNEDEYIIVTANTSLGGAVVLAEKITQKFSSNPEIDRTLNYYFGVTKADETDSMDAILEKLQDALSRSMQRGDKAIEIEV